MRLLALLAGVLCALGCGDRSPGGSGERPNAILISIDTLRADHVGAYGYPRPTTPHIDALADDALRFETAIAHAPTTLASHASILTSLLPWHHGASIPGDTRLAEDVPTLAEVLARHGYHTASFNGGIQLDAGYGLDRGFAVYESARSRDAGPGTLAGEQDRLRSGVARAIRWLERVDGPFFLFLHSYEIHHPYTPDPELLRLFDGDYGGELPDHISVELLERINAGEREATAEDVAHIVSAYDAELRSADEAVGRLFAWLRERGLYDGTLIVVTSDHGEEFGEHGRVGWHAHSLYDELLRVPLLIKLPGSRLGGAVDARQARGIDVAPTMLAALSIPAPEIFAGRDLAAGVPEPEPLPAALSMHDVPGEEPLFAVRTPDWKLKRVGGEALFDLASDPRERRNVAPRHPRTAQRLRRAGWSLLRAREQRVGAPALVPERTREQLEALGYVE